MREDYARERDKEKRRGWGGGTEKALLSLLSPLLLPSFLKVMEVGRDLKGKY
jgi:hypothetical protein